jgi:radical SAM superfamily enzyme YgiQ (UPF0313 family)
MSRILLVKPKARLETITRLNPLVLLEPLELAYLAAAVPASDEVRILDLRLSRKPEKVFLRALREFRPDVVGLSAYTHEVGVVRALARTTRAALPGAMIMVGGPHPTVLPGAFNTPDIDAIVRGEGSLPFGQLIRRLDLGERDFSGVPGVLVPGADYDASAEGRMPLYPDLDEIPFARRDLYDPARYQCVWPTETHPKWKTIFPQVSLIRSSFGCLMECSFCVVPLLSGRRHMRRDPAQVAEEIASVSSEHIYFCDDETFLDPVHAAALAEAIAERGIRKRYFAWARTTTVNRHPELFKRWREIGLDCVFLGFEATSDPELEAIHKHSTVEENLRAHAALRDMGIAVQAGFMVNANFTREDFEKLREFVRKMPPAQLTFTVYTPSPGSPSWHEESKRYICDPFALHDCMHPLTPTALPLKEFFREFASLLDLGPLKHPLRAPGVRFPFRDIFRIITATKSYAKALRNGWRDYDRKVD